MADFLEDKKREIEARLKELRPLVDEYHRLEAAVQALEGVTTNGSSSAAPGRRRRGRPPGSTTAAKGTGRRGRPKGTGTRSKEALSLVRKSPGITIPELAD